MNLLFVLLSDAELKLLYTLIIVTFTLSLSILFIIKLKFITAHDSFFFINFFYRKKLTLLQKISGTFNIEHIVETLKTQIRFVLFLHHTILFRIVQFLYNFFIHYISRSKPKISRQNFLSLLYLYYISVRKLASGCLFKKARKKGASSNKRCHRGRSCHYVTARFREGGRQLGFFL